MSLIEIDITFSGPFLSGRAQQVLDDLGDDCAYRVGNAALEAVQRHLDASIKHPTPYYETQIIQQHHGDAEIVHDRGIVYGPWLEGTSSRNARTSFKGYAAFRKSRDEVGAKVPQLCSDIVARAIAALS